MSTKRPSKRRTYTQVQPAHKQREKCHDCGLWSYPSARAAEPERKRLRRLDRGKGAPPLTTYPCPADDTRWHIGHDHQRANEAASYYTARGAS
jgi:hypothetical protein